LSPIHQLASDLLGGGFGGPGRDATGCKMNGPNPELKPETSDKLGLAWAWYFAPRSAVSISLFHSSINGCPAMARLQLILARSVRHLTVRQQCEGYDEAV
jgi:hypothetical protein